MIVCGEQYLQRSRPTGTWSYPPPASPGSGVTSGRARCGRPSPTARAPPTSSSTTSSPPTATACLPRAGRSATCGGARATTSSAQAAGSTRRSCTAERRPTCSPATSTRATPAPTTGSPTRAIRGRSPRTCARRCRSGAAGGVRGRRRRPRRRGRSGGRRGGGQPAHRLRVRRPHLSRGVAGRLGHLRRRGSWGGSATRWPTAAGSTRRLVSGPYTYLFSGDQYVRYSGAALDVVDDGYPRTLEARSPGELDLPALPERVPRRRRRRVPWLRRRDLPVRGRPLPAGSAARRSRSRVPGAGSATRSPRTGAPRWTPRSSPRPGSSTPSAAVSTSATARARPGSRRRASRARSATTGGTCPTTSRSGSTAPSSSRAARTCVATTGTCGTPTATGPSTAPTRSRSGHASRRRATTGSPTCTRSPGSPSSPTRTPARTAGSAAFLASGPVADPYARLAEPARLGRRARSAGCSAGADSSGAPTTTGSTSRSSCSMHDLFGLADRLGAGPSRIHGDVWQRLHGRRPPTAARRRRRRRGDAGGAPRAGPRPGRVAALAGRIHDTLNVRIRDALVAAVLADDPADGLRTSRDLFDRFLVDVDMGPEAPDLPRSGRRSPPPSCYVHRYLLDLERPTARGDRGRRPRRASAGGGSGCGPTGCGRPTARSSSTPRTTCVRSCARPRRRRSARWRATSCRARSPRCRCSSPTSAISTSTPRSPGSRSRAGTCTPSRATDVGESSLVLFGRTKTDPRRYYYRRASFRSGDSLSTSWEPWLAGRGLDRRRHGASDPRLRPRVRVLGDRRGRPARPCRPAPSSRPTPPAGTTRHPRRRGPA